MSTSTFRLSVEEVALVQTLTGRPDLGQGLLAAGSGEAVGEDESRTRLLTAAHSLMAKEWLAVGVNGDIGLSDALARIGRVLSRADFTIQYSRFAADVDLLLNFHFGEGGIFQHELEQGLVHVITELDDTEPIIDAGLSFFDVDQSQAFSSLSPSKFPSRLLDEFVNASDKTKVVNRLVSTYMATDMAEMLAEDLLEAQYRGSVLRVEYESDGSATSNRGALVLKGPARLWLFQIEIERGESLLVPVSCTREAFSQTVSALL